MKKTKIIYWIFTVLFVLLMLPSGIQGMLLTADAIKFNVDGLHYPAYIIQFIGIAKVLGSIAILIPGFPKIREWAYAGLLFDLIGATYSVFAVNSFQPQMLIMLVFIGIGFMSYVYSHKLSSSTEK